MNNWESSHDKLGEISNSEQEGPLAPSSPTSEETSLPVAERSTGLPDDIYAKIEQALPGETDERYFAEASKSLKQLLKYPFQSRSDEGQEDDRYNFAERVDIIRDEASRTVRCPIRFHEVLKFIEKLRGKKPSIGFKYKVGTVTNYIHFLFEDSDEGWIYIDTQRNLQVRQIHKIEKILDHTGLRRIGIIANKIGLPARHEVSRINTERGKIIDLHYYDTIHNHSLHDFF